VQQAFDSHWLDDVQILRQHIWPLTNPTLLGIRKNPKIYFVTQSLYLHVYFPLLRFPRYVVLVPQHTGCSVCVVENVATSAVPLNKFANLQIIPQLVRLCTAAWHKGNKFICIPGNCKKEKQAGRCTFASQQIIFVFLPLISIVPVNVYIQAKALFCLFSVLWT